MRIVPTPSYVIPLTEEGSSNFCSLIMLRSSRSEATPIPEALLLRRCKGRDIGIWEFSGGHVEAGESFEQAAAREGFEETGIRADNLSYLSHVAGIMKNNRPFITTFYTADVSNKDIGRFPRDEHDVFMWRSVADLLSVENLHQHSRAQVLSLIMHVNTL